MAQQKLTQEQIDRLELRHYKAESARLKLQLNAVTDIDAMRSDENDALRAENTRLDAALADTAAQLTEAVQLVEELDTQLKSVLTAAEIVARNAIRQEAKS